MEETFTAKQLVDLGKLVESVDRIPSAVGGGDTSATMEIEGLVRTTMVGRPPRAIPASTAENADTSADSACQVPFGDMHNVPQAVEETAAATADGLEKWEQESGEKRRSTEVHNADFATTKAKFAAHKAEANSADSVDGMRSMTASLEAPS